MLGVHCSDTKAAHWYNMQISSLRLMLEPIRGVECPKTKSQTSMIAAIIVQLSSNGMVFSLLQPPRCGQVLGSTCGLVHSETHTSLTPTSADQCRRSARDYPLNVSIHCSLPFHYAGIGLETSTPCAARKPTAIHVSEVAWVNLKKVAST
jgi:hypothetical protein